MSDRTPADISALTNSRDGTNLGNGGYPPFCHNTTTPTTGS